MGTILLCVCCHQLPTPALRSLCCSSLGGMHPHFPKRWQRGGPLTNSIWIPALRNPESCHHPAHPLAQSREEHRLTRIRNKRPHFSSQTRQLASCGAREDKESQLFPQIAHIQPFFRPSESRGPPPQLLAGTRAGPGPQSSKVGQRGIETHTKVKMAMMATVMSSWTEMML